MEAIVSNEVQIGVILDKDEKSRISRFLGSIDCVLWEILSPEQRIIYENQRCIKMFADYGMTLDGYTTFLNACHEVAQLTDLPFSLEEDFQGLKTWDAWNDAVDLAIEKARGEMVFG